MTTLVSVVTSTYNRSSLLRESLRGVLGQRGVDLEVIVVDNGSTDDTGAFLETIDDPRLRVIRHEETRGATGGRNAGLAAARGDWVGFCDDDDLWAPDKLRRQLDAAEAAGTVWAYTGCVFVDDDLRLLGGVPPMTPEEVVRELPVRYVIPAGMSNVVWRRDALDADGLLDPRLTLTADWDVSLRLCRSGLPALVLAPLVAYRQHGSNLSRRAAEFQAEISLVEEKFTDLRGNRTVDRGEQLRFVGSELLRAGLRRRAAGAYTQGVRCGDRGSLVRVLGVAVPSIAHPLLRRWFLSDRRWLSEARPWLDDLRQQVALAKAQSSR
ncbi:MAG: glycosyltransferase family 2 protein [Actinomycetota bacterium]|nr:glycosyltransferase family 2 protein [Actinomycetota bacterium]